MPLVGARFVNQNAGSVGIRRVLEVIVEKRLHNGAPEPAGRIAFEMNLADTAAFPPRLAMVPGSQDEMHRLTRGVLACEGLVERGATINIFLLKNTGDDQQRYVQRFFGQQLVDRLLLPEGVVGGVVGDGAPETKLLESAGSSHVTGRSSSQVLVVSIAISGPPLLLRFSCCFLVVDVVERAVLAKGAIMEPVVSNPAVYHWREGHGHFQGRMRAHG